MIFLWLQCSVCKAICLEKNAAIFCETFSEHKSGVWLQNILSLKTSDFLKPKCDFFQSFLSFLWISLEQLLPCVFGKELSHTLASGEWSGWDCTTFVAFIWWRMSRGRDKTERPWDRFAPPGFESVQPPCILLQLHDASFHCWRHCSGGGKTGRK